MLTWNEGVRAGLLAAGLVLLPVCLPAQPPATGIDLVVAIDQSGSMWGHPRLHPAKNDRWQHRVGAAQEIVLRLMADVWESPRVHRFSVIDFGDEAQVVWSCQVLRHDPTDPDAIRREIMPWLERRIAAAALVNTNTPAAMGLAARELEKMSGEEPTSGRRRILLLITDGRPYLPKVGRAELHSRIGQQARKLARLGAEIWVVGLNDADNYWNEGDGEFWRDVAGEERARLAETSAAHLPRIVSDMVDAWLGIDGAIEVDDEFLCPPYLSRLSFRVNFGKPRGSIRILGPDGFEVPQSAGGAYSRPGTYAHFSLADPKPGRYAIDRESDRAYVIRVEASPPRLDLLIPAGPADLGAATPIVLQARTSAGDSLQLLPEWPISASVYVAPPSGSPTKLPLSCTEDGRFEAEWTPTQAGVHELRASGMVTLEDGSTFDVLAGSTAPLIHRVEVSNLRPLWLEISSFRPERGLRVVPWAEETAIELILVDAGGEAVAEVSRMVREPSSWLQLQVLDESGVPLTAPQDMVLTPAAIFSAEVPLQLDWRGSNGLTSLGELSLRILARPEHLAGEHYLKAITLPPGAEHLRINSDPLSAGPVPILLPRWLSAAGWLPLLGMLGLLAWLVFTRWVPDLAISRQDTARHRNVEIRIYDVTTDPTGAGAKTFSVTGKRSFKLDRLVSCLIGGQNVVADRFRVTRLPTPGRARARIEYRWERKGKAYTTRLTAGNYAPLRGLSEGSSQTVAMLSEST